MLNLRVSIGKAAEAQVSHSEWTHVNCSKYLEIRVATMYEISITICKLLSKYQWHFHVVISTKCSTAAPLKKVYI
jgi:hypothetical protein